MDRESLLLIVLVVAMLICCAAMMRMMGSHGHRSDKSDRKDDAGRK